MMRFPPAWLLKQLSASRRKPGPILRAVSRGHGVWVPVSARDDAHECVGARSNQMKAAFIRYLPLLMLALAWEVVARLGLVSSLALPPLSRVTAAWLDLLADGELLRNALLSLYRAGLGLALAVVIGAALGIAMAWWRAVDALVGPLVEMLYPMPKSALIPVTVLWLGFGDGSKIC